MNRSEEILTSLKRHINEVLLVSQRPHVERLELTHRLRQDLGLDSLELAELTVRLESEFGVDVFRDGVVNTVQEVVEKLEIEYS